MRAGMRIVAKTAIMFASLAVLLLVLRGVDLSRAFELVIELNPLLLVGVLFVEGCGLLLRLLRWQLQLRPGRRFRIRDLATPLLVSFAVGNVTLTGVGWVPRVYLLQKKHGGVATFIWGTLIQEYLLDASVIVLWAAIVPFVVKLPAEFRALQFVLALPAVLLLLTDIAVVRRKSLVAGLLRRFGLWDRAFQRLPSWMRDRMEPFTDGFTATFSSGASAAAVAATTLMIWAVDGLFFWVLLTGVSLRLNYQQATAVMVYAHLAIGLPSVPGFIGTLDAATTAMLLALGSPSSNSLAFVVLLRVLLLGPSTIAGGLLAWREGWRFRA